MRLVPFKKNHALTSSLREFEDFQKEMNKIFGLSLFDHPWSDSGVFNEKSWLPAIDVSDEKDTIHVSADLPGLKKEDIHVSLNENLLTIKGEKKNEKEEKKKNYYCSERVSGTFCRTVQLPANVDSSKVKAKYENGELHLIIPKTEGSRTQQIKIE